MSQFPSINAPFPQSPGGIGTSRRQTAGFLVRRAIVHLRPNPCFPRKQPWSIDLDLAKNCSFLNWKSTVPAIELMDGYELNKVKWQNGVKERYYGEVEKKAIWSIDS